MPCPGCLPLRRMPPVADGLRIGLFAQAARDHAHVGYIARVDDTARVPALAAPQIARVHDAGKAQHIHASVHAHLLFAGDD